MRLVLMGAMVGLSGCGADVQRNRYVSREACIADYSEELCRPDFPVSGYVAGTGTNYYGPWYRSDVRERGDDPKDPGPGRYFRGGGVASSGNAAAPASVEMGTRGGFGSTGRIRARGT